MAKRAKLDPDTAQTALDVQQNGVLRVEDTEAEEQETEAPTNGAVLAKNEQTDAKGPQQQGKALLLNGSGKSNEVYKLDIQPWKLRVPVTPDLRYSTRPILDL